MPGGRCQQCANPAIVRKQRLDLRTCAAQEHVPIPRTAQAGRQIAQGRCQRGYGATRRDVLEDRKGRAQPPDRHPHLVDRKRRGSHTGRAGPVQHHIQELPDNERNAVRQHLTGYHHGRTQMPGRYVLPARDGDGLCAQPGAGYCQVHQASDGGGTRMQCRAGAVQRDAAHGLFGCDAPQGAG